MSKTLFWYLLKDLLRIFAMTSATLAGIMSFGALLKPLTQHGLDLGQVGRILSYFSPAMTTYSLPIAALFATTIVYGRMSADNELTACRACGISSLMMTAPAFLLGLIVALISLLFLSFVVPVFTLKVEKVIYSNLAQLVANKITRTHEISYGKTTIFAQAAEVRYPDEVAIVADDPAALDAIERRLQDAGFNPRRDRQTADDGTTTADVIRAAYAGHDWRPTLQAVSDELAPAQRKGVRCDLFFKQEDEGERSQDIKRMMVGLLRWMDLDVFVGHVESQIVDLYDPIIYTYVSMDPPESDDGELLNNGGKSGDRVDKMRVPSRIWMAKRATAYISQGGEEIQLEATLREGSDFPRGTGGSQMSVATAQFGPTPMGTPIRENTKFMDIAQLKELLGSPESSRKLKATVQTFVRDEQRATYFSQIAKSLKDPALRSFRMIAETEALIVSGSDLEVRARAGELVINPKADFATGAVKVVRESNGQEVSTDTARQVRVTLEPVEPTAGGTAERRMLVTVRGYDVIVEADEDPSAHETFPRTINVPMPQELLDVERNNVGYYLKSSKAGKTEQNQLRQDYEKLVASIRAEMHSRASFAVSCFILVMVGCALGMTSKSGNFLSAFAVSVAPALLCIALIVTGQHVCENTPKSMTLGLSLIWSGNVMVMILAVTLLGKLQRH
jgi:lipopolysaccharide export LptBFGC system permease protein LptF